MNNPTYIKLRLALLLVLLLSACSQKSNDQGSVSDNTLSAAIPDTLMAVIFDASNLVVELVVDGGEPQACTGLTVDQINGTFSCSITLPAGARSLSLIYSIDTKTVVFGIVNVTRTSAINVNIVAGQTTPVDFSSATLNNLDSDGDGISNLDEIDEGSDPRAPSYYVGGTVSGLLGSGAVIQLNDGNDLTLSSDGSFNFIPAVADNGSYTVTVSIEPSSPSQTCSVADGSGTVSGANVTNVTVTCAAAAYTVGGTVVGLDGSGLVLQNNAGDDLPISINEDFTFAIAVADGGSYAVTVLTQPSSPSQICSVADGSGPVGGANVTNVTVTCVAAYTVAGTVIGLAGSGLVLQNNAADDLPISLDGNFTFATAVVDGSSYAVTVLTQPVAPNQTCTVTSGAGTISGVNVIDVQVMCSCVLDASRIGNCTLE